MKKILLVLAVPVLLLGVLLTWVKQPMLATTPIGTAALVDEQALESHVRMLSEVFVPRDYAHPENLDRTASYIRQHFELAGDRVSEQTYEVAGADFRNVILELGPEVGKTIVLGAHYDAYEVFPAADDNASGVAGLLELARLLASAELTQPVQLVAYTLEEPPFFRSRQMGSAEHAAQLAEQGVEVDFMISIEMIGYFSSEPGSQTYPLSSLGWIYPTTGDFITVVGNFTNGFLVRQIKQSMASATDLPVQSINAPPMLVQGIDFSDHLNYWRYGYPAVMVTDTSFFRNFAYHTAEDTADRLDYQRMGQVVAGLYQVVAER